MHDEPTKHSFLFPDIYKILMPVKARNLHHFARFCGSLSCFHFCFGKYESQTKDSLNVNTFVTHPRYCQSLTYAIASKRAEKANNKVDQKKYYLRVILEFLHHIAKI